MIKGNAFKSAKAREMFDSCGKNAARVDANRRSSTLESMRKLFSRIFEPGGNTKRLLLGSEVRGMRHDRGEHKHHQRSASERKHHEAKSVNKIDRF